jgi:hypothetical protein
MRITWSVPVTTRENIDAPLTHTGTTHGRLILLDAATGKLLLEVNTGAAVGAGVITYEVGGKQHIAVAGGSISPVWAARRGNQSYHRVPVAGDLQHAVMPRRGGAAAVKSCRVPTPHVRVPAARRARARARHHQPDAVTE